MGQQVFGSITVHYFGGLIVLFEAMEDAVSADEKVNILGDLQYDIWIFEIAR